MRCSASGSSSSIVIGSRAGSSATEGGPGCSQIARDLGADDILHEPRELGREELRHALLFAPDLACELRGVAIPTSAARTSIRV